MIPLTDLNCNSNLAYGTYVHVAVKYGQIKIFKHLCGLLKDWKNLENTEGFTVYDTLMDEKYMLELNNMKPGLMCRSPKLAKKEVSTEFQQEALKFIKEN